MFIASQASDVGSIPIARSITHDDSIVLTPLAPLKRPIKQRFLVPRWSQRNKLVPTSQPEVGRRWPPVLAIGRWEIIVDSTWTDKALLRHVDYFRVARHLPTIGPLHSLLV